MLPTAEHYGWRPTGTKPPEGVPAQEWNGTFLTNDGQLVEKYDAVALAKYLRDAAKSSDLEEVSNSIYAKQMLQAQEEAQQILSQLGLTEKPKGLIACIKRTLFGQKEEKIMDIEPPEIAHISESEMKGALNELALFCDKGAFRIW
jgi:hypothetical protein